MVAVGIVVLLDFQVMNYYLKRYKENNMKLFLFIGWSIIGLYVLLNKKRKVSKFDYFVIWLALTINLIYNYIE
jgi:uncharacterized membrane protein